MATESRTVLLVAGEPSGDQAAAGVVAALRRRCPEWRILAVGGEKMAAAGAEIILPCKEVAVMGFTEVIKNLPLLRRHLKELSRLLCDEVDLFIPVDFPGFNLRLSARARKAGIPVLYFIAPQVWAWGEKRVTTMKRDLTRLAVILPFEKGWFETKGLEVDFVGHPIMESPRPLATGEGRRVALMPGSREQEVKRLLPLMLKTAELLRSGTPDLEFEILESPALSPGFYDGMLEGDKLPLKRKRMECQEFLRDKRGAMVASGTATLETAVAGVPMTVIYQTGALNYWLARRLIKVDQIALVNLVAGEKVVPEFIQGDAVPDAIAAHMGELLRTGEMREAQLTGFQRIRQLLGSAGCGEKVARLAVQIAETR